MHDAHKASHKHSKVIKAMSCIWGPALPGSLGLHPLPSFHVQCPGLTINYMVTLARGSNANNSLLEESRS